MRNTRAGFSLIEIMLVVAIIGIFVALAVPNYHRTQRSSKVAKAKSELRMIQTAVESYRVHDASNEYPASLSDLTSANPRVLMSLPEDPFNTGGADYGYNASANRQFYAIYSIGPEASGSASVNDAGIITETAGTSCIFVSNAQEDTTP